MFVFLYAALTTTNPVYRLIYLHFREGKIVSTNDIKEKSSLLYQLAMDLQYGRSFAGTSLNKAIKFYKKSAGLGNAEAQYALGQFYQYSAFKIDYAKALSFYKKAYNQGNASAAFSLYSMYYYGNGVKKDSKIAEKYLIISAQRGNSFAASQLAGRYFLDKNYLESLRWNKVLASKGDAEYLYKVGDFYEMGYGVQKNNDIAIKYYKQSALYGYTLAKEQLGKGYRYGWWGEPNINLAIYWLTQAARDEKSNTRWLLADIYKQGKGVPVNNELTKKWYLSSIKHCEDLRVNFYPLAEIFLEEKKYDLAYVYLYAYRAIDYTSYYREDNARMMMTYLDKKIINKGKIKSLLQEKNNIIEKYKSCFSRRFF